MEMNDKDTAADQTSESFRTDVEPTQQQSVPAQDSAANGTRTPGHRLMQQ